mmetsp:Transcript_110968/g.324602  ORF Transcript_110968/g.324602 Transcript_110968/m.324602 type:complete len:362 (-) Transcript_110968:41-1126(-)
MSLAGVISGPSAHDPPFFSDVHSLLQNVMGELTRLRESVDSNDVEHQQACDSLRKDIQQECHESRESMNRFRYEFDELVHKRVETVVEGLENMEQSQRFKDRHQQRQIDTLESEVNNLYVNLGNVSKCWKRAKQNSQDSNRLVREMVERQQLDRTASPGKHQQQQPRGRRRSQLETAIDELSEKKAQSEVYELAEQVRSRLRGSAQFIAGEDWQRMLREQDRDGSGQVSFHEFRVTCRTVLKLQEPERSLKLIFDCLDYDGSGEISVEELIEFVSDPQLRMRTRLKKAAQQTGNNWRQVIQMHDVDNSGQISFPEFRRLCHTTLHLPEKDFHLWTVFHAIDKDHSGEVSVRELTAWVEGRR